jgi:hypothetical protein
LGIGAGVLKVVGALLALALWDLWFLVWAWCLAWLPGTTVGNPAVGGAMNGQRATR